MNEAEKYSTLIEKIPQVNEAGKNSMLKYHPEATVSGSYISLNDVSELPHEVKCKVNGVDDPTTVTVTRCGRNLIRYPYNNNTETINGITFTDNGDGSITVNGTAETRAEFRFSQYSEYPQGTYFFSGCPAGGGVNKYLINYFAKDFDNKYIVDTWETGSGLQMVAKQRIKEIGAYLRIYEGQTVTNLVFKPQLEFGGIATKYEPYTEQTFIPKEDGTVEGMTSVSPYMNIFTDTEGVNIEATYRKSKGMEVEKEQFYNSFKKGIITDSISFEWMTTLGATNIRLIVNGLSATATGQTLTLSLAAVNRAFATSSGANDGSTSAAFAELVATKPNWTITLI